MFDMLRDYVSCFIPEQHVVQQEFDFVVSNPLTELRYRYLCCGGAPSWQFLWKIQRK